MANPVEYNDVLALRAWGCPDQNLSEEELISSRLSEGRVYSFRKNGYRIFPLKKTIPLVQTRGVQNFEKVVALILIQSVTVEAEPMGDRVFTFGSYRIVKILNREESDRWMTILSDPLEVR